MPDPNNQNSLITDNPFSLAFTFPKPKKEQKSLSLPKSKFEYGPSFDSDKIKEELKQQREQREQQNKEEVEKSIRLSNQYLQGLTGYGSLGQTLGYLTGSNGISPSSDATYTQPNSEELIQNVKQEKNKDDVLTDAARLYRKATTRFASSREPDGTLTSDKLNSINQQLDSLSSSVTQQLNPSVLDILGRYYDYVDTRAIASMMSNQVKQILPNARIPRGDVIFFERKPDAEKQLKNDIKSGKIKKDDILRINNYINQYTEIAGQIKTLSNQVKDITSKQFALTPEYLKLQKLFDGGVLNQEAQSEIMRMNLELQAIDILNKHPELENYADYSYEESRRTDKGPITKLLEDTNPHSLNQAFFNPKYNQQPGFIVNPDSGTELEKKMRMVRTLKAINDIISESSNQNVVGSGILSGAKSILTGLVDGMLDLSLGFPSLFLHADNPAVSKNWYHMDHLFDKTANEIYNADLTPDLASTALTLHELNTMPVYKDFTSKFLSEAGYQAGNMIPFVLALTATGATAAMGRMMEKGGEVGLKGVFKWSFLREFAFPTYARAFTSGVWLTGPSYLSPTIDKLMADPNSTWLDWIGNISLKTFQSGMEGMSEATSAHFGELIMGKAVSKMFPHLTFKNDITKRTFNYFLSENIGEVMEERINDLVSDNFLSILKGESYTDDSGHKRQGLINWLEDEFNQSLYEYAMFAFSSGVNAVGVNALNPSNVYNSYTFNKFTTHLNDRIIADAKQKGIDIDRKGLEKTLENLYLMFRNTSKESKQEMENKAFTYVMQSLSDETTRQIHNENGLTVGQLIEGANRTAVSQHVDENYSNIKKTFDALDEFPVSAVHIPLLVEDSNKSEETTKENFPSEEDVSKEEEKTRNILSDQDTFKKWATENPNGYNNFIKDLTNNLTGAQKYIVVNEFLNPILKTGVETGLMNIDDYVEAIKNGQFDKVLGVALQINDISTVENFGAKMTGELLLNYDRETQHNILESVGINKDDARFLKVSDFENLSEENKKKLLSYVEPLSENYKKPDKHSETLNSLIKKGEYRNKGLYGLSVKGDIPVESKLESREMGLTPDDEVNQVMSEQADSFIGEVRRGENRESPVYSFMSKTATKEKGMYILSTDDVSVAISSSPQTVMILRDESLKGKPLSAEMKYQISRTADMRPYVEFIVGDRPGIDDKVIEYLERNNLPYFIYHTGINSRIAPQIDENGQVIVGPTTEHGGKITYIPPKKIPSYKFAFINEVPSGDKIYEVSSSGDYRFSDLEATLSDGKTIKEAFEPFLARYKSTDKSVKPLTYKQLYLTYKNLWRQWADEHPDEIASLAVEAKGKTLTNKYAKTNINNARVLSEILEERFGDIGRVAPRPILPGAKEKPTMSVAERRAKEEEGLPRIGISREIEGLEKDLPPSFQGTVTFKSWHELNDALVDVADNFIGEITGFQNTFIKKIYNGIAMKNTGTKTVKNDTPTKVVRSSASNVVVVLREKDRVDEELLGETKERIKEIVSSENPMFVVGKSDMVLIKFLLEIGAPFTIYTSGKIEDINADKEKPKEEVPPIEELVPVVETNKEEKKEEEKKEEVPPVSEEKTPSSPAAVEKKVSPPLVRQEAIPIPVEEIVSPKEKTLPQSEEKTLPPFSELRSAYTNVEELFDDLKKIKIETLRTREYLDLIGTIAISGTIKDKITVNIVKEKRIYQDRNTSLRGNYSIDKTTGEHIITIYAGNMQTNTQALKSLAHELIHAVLNENENYKYFTNVYKSWANFVRLGAIDADVILKKNPEFISDYKAAENLILSSPDEYTRVQEFTAEAMTNPLFQSVLNSITTKKKSHITLLQRFVKTVAQVLERIGIHINSHSLLFDTIDIMDRIIYASVEGKSQADIANIIRTVQYDGAKALTEEEILKSWRLQQAEKKIEEQLTRTRQPVVEESSLEGDIDVVMEAEQLKGGIESEDVLDDFIAEKKEEMYLDTVIINGMVNKDGAPIFETTDELYDEIVKLGSLEAFKEKYKDVTPPEEMNDYFISDFLSFVYASMINRKRYTVAEYAGGGEWVKVKLHEKSYYGFDGTRKSTLMHRLKIDDLTEELEKRKGIKGIQIFPLVKVAVSVHTKDAVDTVEHDTKFTNLKRDRWVISNLYYYGYVLLPNKNVQYLVKVLNEDKTSAIEGYTPTGNAITDTYNIWKMFLDVSTQEVEGNIASQLKRFGNMMGSSSTSYLYDEVKQVMLDSPGRWEITSDGKVNIKQVVLDLNINTFKDAPKDSLAGMFYDEFAKYGNEKFFADGAVFQRTDTHNLFQVMNNTPTSEFGNAYKARISKPGLLVKAAFFQVKKGSLLDLFMEKNGLERVVVKSALKIGLGKGSQYEGKKAITYQDLIRNMRGQALPENTIITHNLMEDTYMFSKGEIKTSVGGIDGSVLTNSFSQFNTKFKENMEQLWNSQYDSLMKYLTSDHAGVDKINDIKKYIIANPSLLSDVQVKAVVQIIAAEESLGNGFANGLNPFIANFYINHILKAKVEKALFHRVDSYAPVLCPDLAFMGGEREFVKSNLIKNGMSAEDADRRIEQWFSPSGAIKPGYVIIDSKYARNKKITWEKIVSGKGTEIFYTVNPVGFMYDGRVVNVIGIEESIPWKFNGKQVDTAGNSVIASMHDFVLRSGKDHDIDVLIGTTNRLYIDAFRHPDINKEGDEILKRLEEDEPKELAYTGSIQQLAEVLGMDEVPLWYYRLVQIFGLVQQETRGLNLVPTHQSICDVSDKLSGNPFSIGVSIGFVYTEKTFNDAVGQLIDFNNKRNGTRSDSVDISLPYGKENKLSLRKLTPFEHNLAILKHLTDMSIDWLSDQLILNLDINYGKLTKVMFGLSSDGEGRTVYHGLEQYLGPVRNLSRVKSFIGAGKSYFYGLNKLISDAEKSLNYPSNPFGQSTILGKTASTLIGQWESSIMGKVCLSEEEEKFYIEQLAKRIGLNVTDGYDELDMLYSFLRIPAMSPLENIKISKLSSVGFSGKPTYFGAPDNGMANLVFSANKWQYFYAKAKLADKNITYNPFVDLFGYVSSNSALSKDAKGKTKQFFNSARPEDRRVHRMVIDEDGNIKFSFILLENRNFLSKVEKVIMETDNFEDYVKNLSSIDMCGSHSLNESEIRNTFLQVTFVSSFFPAFDIKTRGLVKVVDNIVFERIIPILFQYSAAPKKYIAASFIPYMVQFKQNAYHPITYGFTGGKNFAYKHDEESGENIIADPSRGIYALIRVSQTEAEAMKYFQNYCYADKDIAKQLPNGKRDESLNSIEDNDADIGDEEFNPELFAKQSREEAEKRKTEKNKTGEEEQDEDRVAYEASVKIIDAEQDIVNEATEDQSVENEVYKFDIDVIDRDKKAYGGIEYTKEEEEKLREGFSFEGDNSGPISNEFWEEFEKKCKEEGHTPQDLNAVEYAFRKGRLYQELIRKDAFINGIDIENVPLDTPLARFWVMHGARTVYLQNVLDLFNILHQGGKRFKKWRKISGNMVDWCIQYMIHGEFGQAQSDIDDLMSNFHVIFAEDLTGLERVESSMYGVMEKLASEMTEQTDENKVLSGLWFDSSGNVVYDGKKYTIFMNPHQKKTSDGREQDQKRAFVRKQNVQNTEGLFELANVIFDKYNFRGEKYEKSVMIRSIMNAINARYVYEYYTPELFEDHARALSSTRTNIIDKLPNGRLKTMAEERYGILFRKLNKMILQLKGKTESLDRQGYAYFPHMITNMEEFRDELVSYFMNQNNTPEKAQKLANDIIEKSKTEAQQFGNFPMFPGSRYFNERFLDEAKGYRKDLIGVTEAYLRSMNVFMRNQSLFLNQLLNERFTGLTESPLLTRERLFNNSLLRSDTVFWEPTKFENLKAGDVVQFYNSGEILGGTAVGEGYTAVVDFVNRENGTVMISTKDGELITYRKTNMRNLCVQRGNSIFSKMKAFNHWKKYDKNEIKVGDVIRFTYSLTIVDTDKEKAEKEKKKEIENKKENKKEGKKEKVVSIANSSSILVKKNFTKGYTAPAVIKGITVSGDGKRIFSISEGVEGDGQPFNEDQMQNVMVRTVPTIIISKTGRLQELGMRFTNEAIQALSRIFLGVENFLFNPRNKISGLLQLRAETGSLEAQKASAMLNDIIEAMTKKKFEGSDKDRNELLNTIIDYKTAIGGAVDELLGRYGGVIASLGSIADRDTVKYFEEMHKQFKAKSKEAQNIIDKMKLDKNYLNMSELSKIDKFFKAVDHTYKALGLYSFPFGLLDRHSDWSEYNFVHGWINVTKTEGFLRTYAAARAVLLLQDQWDWEHNKDNHAFTEMFNSFATSTILKIVRNSQVSYIPGIDLAGIDASKIGKLFITQFGHYGMAQQAVFIQQFRNMMIQLDRYGLKMFLSKDTLHDIEELSNGDVYSVGVRNSFRTIGFKTIMAVVSELFRAAVAMGGKKIADYILGPMLNPVVQALIDGVYMQSISSSAPIPVLNITIRTMFLLLSYLINTVPDPEDKEGKKIIKRYLEGWGQTQSEYIETIKKRNESIINPASKKHEEMLRASWMQDMSFRFLSPVPGMGFSRLLNGLMQYVIHVSTGIPMNDYWFNMTKSFIPFNHFLTPVSKSILGENAIVGRSAFSTHQQRVKDIKQQMNDLDKELQDIVKQRLESGLSQEEKQKLSEEQKKNREKYRKLVKDEAKLISGR